MLKHVQRRWLWGLNTCRRYCPISLIIERFLYILLKDVVRVYGSLDVVWVCGSLNDVWGMKGSHYVFHCGRIR